jgi:hypothetical protein
MNAAVLIAKVGLRDSSIDHHNLVRLRSNEVCSWRRSYGTRGGTRFARVHRASLLDPPQLIAIR